jgi:hypothetical protein
MSNELREFIEKMLDIASTIAKLTKTPKDDIVIDALKKVLSCYD